MPLTDLGEPPAPPRRVDTYSPRNSRILGTPGPETMVLAEHEHPSPRQGDRGPGHGLRGARGRRRTGGSCSGSSQQQRSWASRGRRTSGCRARPPHYPPAAPTQASPTRSPDEGFKVSLSVTES